MDLYVNEGDLNKEIESRLKNQDLIKNVNKHLKKIPEPFCNFDKKIGVLVRNIITPDFELEKFLEKTRQNKLTPILIEYTKDKFVPENEDKKSFAKMMFYRGIYKNNEVLFDVFKIIDFNCSSKKKIIDIKTVWNESICNFHHRILQYYYPEINDQMYDFSDWFHDNGGVAKNYYNNFLALFLYNAVLFDNFRTSDKEGEFFNQIFLPAFNNVKEKFGFKPMIVPIFDVDDEDNPKWWGYDISKKDQIIKMSKQA